MSCERQSDCRKASFCATHSGATKGVGAHAVWNLGSECKPEVCQAQSVQAVSKALVMLQIVSGNS